MNHPMFDDSRTVLRARQEFLAKGSLQQGAVADVIERSWRRCLENGVDATSPPHNEVITQQELARRLEQHHLLISHARPEMATLNEQISHTRSIVILTDHEGVILHSMGDSSFLSEAQRISLSPGCSWHENHRGTNAIGTALVEKLPLAVHGAEHFMERHHFLSCSAVPIFGAKNGLAGTLDVSNDFLLPQQHTLALVKMAAQMIENRLFRAHHKSEIALHFHARPEFIGTLWEGIAMFSGNGKLVATNRSGQFQLELNLNGQEIHFDDVFDAPLGALLGRTGDTGKLIFSLRLKNGARIFASMELDPLLKSSAPPAPLPAVRPAKRNCAANFDMLDSGDARMARAISQVKLVLNRDISILIEGETGVGKELFARAVHEAGNRCDGPWVAVNCAALPEGLIEAELFGYEEGAFTGARRKGSPGKLEQAHGGTLFLDEIGDMPLSLQARLLRVLQERSVTPLGSTRSRPVDFALVSATNQKLREKVERGEFRSDLYYRLNGLSVTLPPLRQRADMAALIDMLLQIEHADNTAVTPDIMELFQAHPWPGNIRQLHNVIRTALALSADGPIGQPHLTQDFLDDIMRAAHVETDTASLDSLTLEVVRKALHAHAGNVSAAARQLGISRNTLYRKLKILGLA
ncbi:MAG TPA: sigma-54-dependent Fis family transcriptional regulator [Novimethylophilus sp.]|jgi:transcriptional regulator of acetoin/glycerol metabolism|uniref:sigma-54-dependent Fis family transcriptional regulator n=1 Tax=Novimethylophilus sp. TaxID=2137426 RepID=UPI002F42B140